MTDLSIDSNLNINQIPGIKIKQQISKQVSPSQLFARQKKYRLYAPQTIREILKNYPTSTTATTYALMTQEHGNRCSIVHHPRLLHYADASITQKSQIALSVYTADCLPIILSTQKGDTISAIHAGWRGLYSNIIPITIHKIPAKANQLIAWIGPSISPERYEVTPTFQTQFISQHPDAKTFFTYNQKSLTFDCRGFATRQLRTCGIKIIDQTDLCTFNSEQLPSYRQSKGKTKYRLWTHIWKT